MATTTPNFGWTVPTSTDLVKDGAIAIETLGDGIDASFVDLKGGTTGQILTKASSTDLDFAWAAASGGGTYSAYTPSWTNLTVGNGTVIARYTNVGKFVHGYVRFTLGSTSSIGSSPKFSLPSTPQTGGLMNYGYGMYEDTGTANVAAYVTNDANLLILRYTTSATGSIGSITSTAPFTWTTGDGIAIQFVYEEA